MRITLEFDDFQRAYRQLEAAPLGYYKEIYADEMRIFGQNLNENIESVLDHLRQKTYRPSTAYKIYLPKKDNLVRPITVLTFVDLLIYQAIANIVADTFHERLSRYYNKQVFGNLHSNQGTSNKYFFTYWKKQWKTFERTTKAIYNKGFVYLLEFDLASFYDTVDHSLLFNRLMAGGVGAEIIELLEKQLKRWTVDGSRENPAFAHGIPQGMQASGIFAEIYLEYIDEKMCAAMRQNRDIKYLRYVDDIRLFAKNEYNATRYLAYLDLLSKDIGLIPQGHKIAITEIKDIDAFLKNNRGFSMMDYQMKRTGTLSDHHNRVLLDKLKQTMKNETFDKTVMKFGLYRVWGDHELKELLIAHSMKVTPMLEDVCYYLRKHFLSDPLVQQWAVASAREEHPLYLWKIAVLFKFFYEIIPFDATLLETARDHKFYWYVYYWMLPWLAYHRADLLPDLKDHDNSIVHQRIVRLKESSASENQKKEVVSFIPAS